MNTMKKILAFAMAVSMVLVCLVPSVFAAETKKEYVSDGLVAWYDASNNNNGTQNKQADLWKDLSGNANHISVADAYSRGEIEWTDTALVFQEQGAYLRLPTAVVAALESNAYTIEIVTGNLDYTASSYITLLSSPNDELSVFIRVHNEYSPDIPNNPQQYKLEYKNQDKNKDENRPYIYNAWDKFNGKTLAITSDLTALSPDYDFENREQAMDRIPDQPANVYMYSDAEVVGKGKSKYNMTLDGYAYLGNTSEARAWSGEIYGLRIYNRALTAEEVAANAEADQYNYRENRTFAPAEVYDPALDANYEGFAKIEATDNRIIPFSQATDLIPLTGFYGSENLFDYMYPLESDEPWEGARLMQTEDLETDQAGATINEVRFRVLYDSFCQRASLETLPASQTNYIVIKLIVNGDFEDFNMTAVGYDADTQEELDFATGSTFGGIDYDLDGQVQYLVYDVEGIFDECEYLTKFKFDLAGMTTETEIYLLEMALLATEEQVEAYQNGEELPEGPAEPENPGEGDQGGNDQGGNDQGGNDQGGNDQGGNDQGGNDQGGNDQGGNDQGGNDQGGNDQGGKDDGKDDGETTTKKEETTTAAPAKEEGCASVVGFGAAAILVAAAAAVVLKKKD